MLVPLALGAALGAGLFAVMAATGMARDRGAAAVTLIAVAAFYPAFAAEDGIRAELALHLAIAAAFLVVAVAGYLRACLLIAAGLLAHGLFDAVARPFAPSVPTWWPAFCAGIDVVLGLGLAVTLRKSA